MDWEVGCGEKLLSLSDLFLQGPFSFPSFANQVEQKKYFLPLVKRQGGLGGGWVLSEAVRSQGAPGLRQCLGMG